MSMIAKDTATDIALAYREIEVAEKLLTEIEGEVERWTGKEAPDIRDAFGRRVYGLELGVPSAAGSLRLFNVPWKLAKPVIQAHIANKKAELGALFCKAQDELLGTWPMAPDGPVPVPPAAEAEGTDHG
jgi:hypothetical protein